MTWHNDASYVHLSMNIIEIVAANVMALKLASGDSYATLEKKTAENKHQVARTTIERIAKGSRSCQVEDLAALATVFGVEPWHLLVPNWKPGNPPVLRSVGKVEDDLYSRLGSLEKEIGSLKESIPQGRR